MQAFKKAGIITAMLFGMVCIGNVSEAIEYSGYLRNYTGFLLDEENEYTMQQNTLDLKIEHSVGKASLLVNPYFYDYQSREDEIDLRQAFVDVYFDSTDVRVGKQQIVWGKADGVFITDVVSPKNLTHYLLPDFEEIRIGINALKTVTYFGGSALEFVWVPGFTPTTLPNRDSIWYVEPDFPYDFEFDYRRKAVESKISNSEVFLRFSAMSSAVDFEIIAGHFWDDDATNHMVLTMDELTNEPLLIIIPEHHRLSMAGGSFSSSLGFGVVRGEAAYYSGKYFQSEDPTLEERVVSKDYLHYLVGLDSTLYGIDLVLQLIDQRILGHDEHMVDDQEVNTTTLLVREDFMRETLKIELMCYINHNTQDSLYRPKLSYNIVDNVTVQVGASIFEGDEGPYGRYDKNDNAFASIKLSF